MFGAQGRQCVLIQCLMLALEAYRAVPEQPAMIQTVQDRGTRTVNDPGWVKIIDTQAPAPPMGAGIKPGDDSGKQGTQMQWT